MHSHPDIDSYFIETMPNNRPPVVDKDVIRVYGTDEHMTIRHKTLAALEHLLQDQRYTHIVRTNLSSFWILPRLMDTLRACPQTGLYGGIYLGENAISGAGIILSRDVVQTLLAHKDIVFQEGAHWVFNQDDISFGRALGAAGVQRTYISRFDILDANLFDQHVKQLPPSICHLRLRQSNDADRTSGKENMIMEKLIDMFY